MTRYSHFHIVSGVMGVLLSVCPAWAEDEPAGPLFENVAAAVGLGGVESNRVAFADFDGDGVPDALIGSTRVFLNRDGRFVRSEHDGVLAPEGTTAPSVAQVGDVNEDGRFDLYLGYYAENKPEAADVPRNAIWLGDGHGGFRRLDESGVGRLAETNITACFVDYDRDGHLDLFVGNAYVAYGDSYEAFPDRLWRGRGDGTFVDVTESAGLLGIAETGQRDSRRPTYGVTHTDWNNDGHQDLLVATYGRQWNRLWRNNGDGTFTDVGAETGFDGDEERSGEYPPEVEREKEEPFRANGNTFDCAVADFDGDGDMDCFLAEITHWWAGPSSDRSTLLVNEGPAAAFRFKRDAARIERQHSVEHWNQGDLHAGWLDVDNDGRLDLLIASSDYPDEQLLRLYHQEEGGRFVEWTERLGCTWINASQISLGDFDRDGATDILVGTNNMRLTEEQRKGHDLSVGLLRNLVAGRSGNRFLNIRLDGQAIGARVVIEVGGRRQIREVQGGLGHAGHRDDTDCRFGVGPAKVVDVVEVHWPNAAGTMRRFTNVETNRFYRLRQGGELEVQER
ncbi:MAG: CRTAC1 family protein [Phycisphaerae bacterium]|jgi:hypothetical protein